ncbi:dUTP diphosphatase [Pseudohongiella spirulinae]|uniref:Leucyl/phenylalanyl-tRNA--protein transferase n=1 Tax=Pseudohongiella spirulinae TaxID=1249552 RepID=A0A0S2KCR8_9GAMM|nr:dUTP diphosphatase [Pseudohongiella spirulinae]ALO46120.1 Leucyl/phenylalanyl-tRNA--protein transferase [Pseudohongiella spirulinae]
MIPAIAAAPARVMLQLQAAMNSKVDPEWISARYPYLRAVVIEAAEAIEHHGWKWWKKQLMDLPQLQMEIIDIWHFILSEMLLENDGNVENTLPQLTDWQYENTLEFDSQTYTINERSLLDKLELLIALSASRRIDLSVFAAIMKDCELDWSSLFTQYVGKNVLNFFRQDNGYKEGHYQKLWNGREDNEILVEVMGGLDANDPLYAEHLYNGLRDRYPARP